MNSEDEKHQKMMKAVSVFYSDAANSESVFGRLVTDIERHMFRIGANLFSNLKHDTFPITGLVSHIAMNQILSECDDDAFFGDEFALVSARRAAWHAVKSAIEKKELIVRDGRSMVPVNETPWVLAWCATDSPKLDQESANVVVKFEDARRWIKESGIPIPEWMLQSSDVETVEEKTKNSGVTATKNVEWEYHSRSLYEELRKQYPERTRELIAEEIRKRLGEQGIVGRGGKVPTAATILRRGMKK